MIGSGKKAILIFLGVLFFKFSYAQDKVHEVSLSFDDLCTQIRQMKIESKSGKKTCEFSKGTFNTAALDQLSESVDFLQVQALIHDSLKMCEKIDRFGRVVSDQKHLPPSFDVMDQNNNRWRFKFYFGNTKTDYNKTNAKIKTSRLDLTLNGLQPYERRSDSYYKNFFHESVEDMAKVVDEPTNTFTFVMEKNKDEVFLKIFHPKFVFVEGDQDFNGHGYYNNNVKVSGTADGQKINGQLPLRGSFTPGHQLKDGQLGFVSWENSHKLLQTEVGYGREIVLVKSRDQPILKYTPEASVGVYVGIENSAYIGKSHYQYDFESYSDGSNSNSNMKVMGYSASVSQRLELNNRKNNTGVYAVHNFSYGKMDYPFLDGNVKHDVSYNSFTVGVSLAVRPKKTYTQIKKSLSSKKEVSDNRISSP